MFADLFLAILACQFADDPAFPVAMQKNALAATVRVFHPASRNDGSGVVIRFENGFAFILTAAHIVPTALKNADEVEIIFYPPGVKPLDAVRMKTLVKARMPKEDLALIELPLKAPPPGVSPLCPKPDWPKTPLKAEMPLRVLTIGIGERDPPEAIADWVREHKSVTKPDGTKAIHWEADLAQPQGRSGGPMLDTQGRVIGICTGKMSGKGYYLAIDEIFYLLEKGGYRFLVK